MISKTEFTRGIILRADDVATEGISGELKVALTTQKLQVYLDSALREVVTTTQVQTLTNKTLDLDFNTLSNIEVDNLKAGVLNIDPGLAGATDSQIPSALAVKTLSDSVQNQVNNLVTLTGVPVNSVDLGSFTGNIIPDNSDIKEAFQSLETVADETNRQLTVAGSTGLEFGGVLSINADPTKFDLSAGEGWVVDSDDFSAPTRTRVTFGPFTAQTVTNLLTSPVTYISIDSAGAIVQQTSFPTPEEKRDNIFIGRLNHQNLTDISFADTFPDILQSEQSQYYDLVDAIGPFNYQGNIVTANGVNLSIDKSSGKVFNASFNYVANNQSPNNVSTGALSPASFVKQTQTINVGGSVTVIDPANYDVAGTVTAVPGAGTVATVQRVYLFPSNNVRIQYGQAVYANLAEALAEFDSEEFIENPTNTGVAILIGFIAVTKAATDLSDPAQARIILAPKFGGATGAASAATTNLQQAYDNSVTPEITTNSSLGALSIKRGSAADADNVFEVQNGAGTNVVTAKGTGDLSAGKLIVDNLTLDADSITGNALTVTGSTSSIITGGSSSVSIGTNIVSTTATEIHNGALVHSPLSDTTTSGANATINAGNNKTVILSNVGLTGIDMIVSNLSGQEITLINRTGNPITINNDTGATAVYRIKTANAAAVTFPDETALNFVFDTLENRWAIIGGTGSGSGASVPEVFVQLDASELLSTWSTGNNATFLGGGVLSGTFVKDTATPLNGTASYLYTQAGGSLNDYLASSVQEVPLRFRGNDVAMTFVYTYDGNTNDIEAIVYDVTNGAKLTDSTSLISTSSTVSSVYKVIVHIPTNCTQIRVGFQTKVLNSGKAFQFDDIQLTSDTLAFADISTSTATTSFTPTGSWNTNTTYGGRWYRDGEYAFFNVMLTLSGAPNATTLTINIPTSVGVVDTSKMTQGVTTVGYGSTLIGASRQIANAVFSTSAPTTVTLTTTQTVAGTNPVNTTQASITNLIPGTFASGHTVEVNFKVPILGWTNSSPNIVTAPDTFSTDTASLVYAGSATYTLATLANAPVGTFITFTYALNTNTRTQTNAAPTQTTADMNQNGIQIFTRAYNVASTAASPAAVAIQIGKGLKGITKDVYKSTGKSIAGELDRAIFSSSSEEGMAFKNYNEITGILYLDAGGDKQITNTSSVLLFQDGTSQTNGYLVINASKNPAMTGLNVGAVAARGVNTSGQSIAATDTVVTYDAVKTFDTHSALNSATGVFTAPITGYYSIEASLGLISDTYAINGGFTIQGFKNGVLYSDSLSRSQAAASYGATVVYTDIVFLTQGNTFDLRAVTTSGPTALQVSAARNYFSIIKTNVG